MQQRCLWQRSCLPAPRGPLYLQEATRCLSKQWAALLGCSPTTSHKNQCILAYGRGPKNSSSRSCSRTLMLWSLQQRDWQPCQMPSGAGAPRMPHWCASCLWQAASAVSPILLGQGSADWERHATKVCAPYIFDGECRPAAQVAKHMLHGETPRWFLGQGAEVGRIAKKEGYRRVLRRQKANRRNTEDQWLKCHRRCLRCPRPLHSAMSWLFQCVKLFQEHQVLLTYIASRPLMVRRQVKQLAAVFQMGALKVAAAAT